MSVTTYQELNCFCEIVLKFDKGVHYKKFIGKCELCENQLGDIRTVLGGLNKFLPILSIFWLILVEFDIDDTCVMPLSSGDFRENQHIEIRALFRGMNEYMFVLSTFMYDLGGMQCNKTACNDVKNL